MPRIVDQFAERAKQIAPNLEISSLLRGPQVPQSQPAQPAQNGLADWSKIGQDLTRRPQQPMPRGTAVMPLLRDDGLMPGGDGRMYRQNPDGSVAPAQVPQQRPDMGMLRQRREQYRERQRQATMQQRGKARGGAHKDVAAPVGAGTPRFAQEQAFAQAERDRAELAKKESADRQRIQNVNLSTVDMEQRFGGMSDEDAQYWRDLAPEMTESEFRQRIQKYRREAASPDPVEASEAFIDLGAESGHFDESDESYLRAYARIEGVTRADVQREAQRLQKESASREQDFRNEQEKERDQQANREFLDGMVKQGRINDEQAELLRSDAMLSASQSEYRQRLNALKPPKRDAQKQPSTGELIQLAGMDKETLFAMSPDEVLAELNRGLEIWKQLPGNQQEQDEQGPTVGTVEDGYVFLGGDPSDPESWSKARD